MFPQVNPYTSLRGCNVFLQDCSGKRGGLVSDTTNQSKYSQINYMYGINIPQAQTLEAGNSSSREHSLSSISLHLAKERLLMILNIEESTRKVALMIVYVIANNQPMSCRNCPLADL